MPSIKLCTHHKVTDDHCKQKKRDADDSGAEHTVPHGLDPLAAQDAEYYHERVKEVGEVPAWNSRKVFLRVVDAVQLHAHHGEYEDDDGKHNAEIAESSHRSSDDSDEQIQCRPRLRQLEHPQLTTVVTVHKQPSIRNLEQARNRTNFDYASKIKQQCNELLKLCH